MAEKRRQSVGAPLVGALRQGYYGVRIKMRLPWGTGRMWSFIRRGLATLLNMPNALRMSRMTTSKPAIPDRKTALALA